MDTGGGPSSGGCASGPPFNRQAPPGRSPPVAGDARPIDPSVEPIALQQHRQRCIRHRGAGVGAAHGHRILGGHARRECPEHRHTASGYGRAPSFGLPRSTSQVTIRTAHTSGCADPMWLRGPVDRLKWTSADPDRLRGSSKRDRVGALSPTHNLAGKDRLWVVVKIVKSLTHNPTTSL